MPCDAGQDADIDAHRKGLKAQATTFQFKLESSRAANNVNLQNQAAEMTHSFDTQMERKVRDMQSGEADLLTQAHQEMAELRAELHEKRKELDMAEQLIKTTKKLLSSKEAQEVQAGYRLGTGWVQAGAGWVHARCRLGVRGRVRSSSPLHSSKEDRRR